MDPCPLCAPATPRGEEREPVLWRGDVARVVLACEQQQPGRCCVVLARHAAELSDLEPGDCQRLLAVVVAVERALRAALRPDKVNVASLGNVVPHVHWHVIPRWRDDPWFPDAVWAPPRRETPARAAPPDLPATLAAALRATLGPH